ncbi:hypothetical protein R9X47_02360 [Wukongibacter baidiensis]|uniref:hypothetical protein n=1 Tax=Wukongibacter baidiensis TaxID=1723361 RepID=UPI003D7F42D6
MENKILDMKYVIENGVDYENLETEMFTEKLIEAGSDKGYTGLVYESINENQISGYVFYKDGYVDGLQVDFYLNGSVKRIINKKDGIADGEYKKWSEENTLIEEGEYRFGIQTKYRKYNIYGQVVDEKKEPTEFELEHIRNKEKNMNN